MLLRGSQRSRVRRGVFLYGGACLQSAPTESTEQQAMELPIPSLWRSHLLLLIVVLSMQVLHVQALRLGERNMFHNGSRLLPTRDCDQGCASRLRLERLLDRYKESVRASLGRNKSQLLREKESKEVAVYKREDGEDKERNKSQLLLRKQRKEAPAYKRENGEGYERNKSQLLLYAPRRINVYKDAYGEDIVKAFGPDVPEGQRRKEAFLRLGTGWDFSWVKCDDDSSFNPQAPSVYIQNILQLDADDKFCKHLQESEQGTQGCNFNISYEDPFGDVFDSAGHAIMGSLQVFDEIKRVYHKVSFKFGCTTTGTSYDDSWASGIWGFSKGGNKLSFIEQLNSNHAYSICHPRPVSDTTGFLSLYESKKTKADVPYSFTQLFPPKYYPGFHRLLDGPKDYYVSILEIMVGTTSIKSARRSLTARFDSGYPFAKIAARWYDLFHKAWTEELTKPEYQPMGDPFPYDDVLQTCYKFPNEFKKLPTVTFTLGSLQVFTPNIDFGNRYLYNDKETTEQCVCLAYLKMLEIESDVDVVFGSIQLQGTRMLFDFSVGELGIQHEAC